MNTSANENPEKLEAEIEATRAHMDATLDAIEHKLSPGQLLDESLDYFRRNGSGEFFSNLTRSAQSNPMPVVLTSLGIGWLMMSNPARHEGDGARFAEAKGKAREAAGKAKEGAHEARARMHHAREQTRAFGRRATDNARQAMDWSSRMLHEQPLVVGALGIALGAALAASLPSTETEDRMLGEARDKVVEKATEVGQEQAEKLKSTAHAASEAARQEADREGLTQRH
ncbi:MAG TPA: DUF3618 domain-containing protein [Gammaproteobacteria bacterium]|nr:DUF3618 domain-containing protein [Gammaproteobacteria bacterium]